MSGEVVHVAASGRTVVGYGTQERGSETWGSVWTSTDGGRTWHLARLAGDGGVRISVDPHVLERTAGGFLGVGSVGRAGDARPVLWPSADGRWWQRMVAGDARLGAAGDWTINGMAVVGARAVGIATRVTRAGSTPVVFSQPLP